MCIQAPTVPSPSLGGGLSIAPPTLPTFSGNVGLCCKTVPYSTPPLPLPFPPGTFNPAFALALNTALATVQAYLDELTPNCPRE